MNERLDIRFLMGDSRARVYLLWAAITGVGYGATHYYQRGNINYLWLILVIAGFVFMYKAMPLRVDQMKRIYASWLIPITVGILVSVYAAPTTAFLKVLDTLSFLQPISDALVGVAPYLGAFWLAVQAVAFFLNGLVDAPARWYYVAAIVNLAAAVICYIYELATTGQYLIAATVSVWSMLMLWVYRTD